MINDYVVVLVECEMYVDTTTVLNIVSILSSSDTELFWLVLSLEFLCIFTGATSQFE